MVKTDTKEAPGLVRESAYGAGVVERAGAHGAAGVRRW